MILRNEIVVKIQLGAQRAFLLLLEGRGDERAVFYKLRLILV